MKKRIFLMKKEVIIIRRIAGIFLEEVERVLHQRFVYL
jgi:hypothetical protein